MERNWPCKLCDQECETAEHVVLRCVFAQDAWTDGLMNVPLRIVSMADRWNSAVQGLPKKLKRASGLTIDLYGVKYLEGA